MKSWGKVAMRVEGAIYLDYQATAPIDPRVLAAMEPFLRHEFGNPHSSEHSFGWRAAEAVDRASGQVSELIGADSDEIFFTSGATESNNLALLGLARRARSGRRRRILISAIEHKCVLATARAIADQLGFKIDLLPVKRDGALDLDWLRATISDDVLAVSVMAVNNEIGTLEPIQEISTIARQYGVLFHCDAAQAPCALDISQITTMVDLLSLSGHKIYGPKGIGALYIRRDLHSQIEPLVYGGGQQRNLRSGTVPTFLAVGMGAAASCISHGDSKGERDVLRKHVHKFLSGLHTNKVAIVLNGPPLDRRHPGNANLQFEGFDAQDILGALQPHLAASTGSACSSGVPEPSHVLKAIGLTSEEITSSIRFSFGRFNSDEDVESAISLLTETLRRIDKSGLHSLGRAP